MIFYFCSLQFPIFNELLWDQELKYRPGFTTENQLVNIPVIFAKVSGVRDGQDKLHNLLTY